MLWLKGYLAESLRCYEKSLPLARKVGDSSLICVLYNNIGVIYYGVGDYEKALKYYYMTLPLRDFLSDYQGKSLTLNNIGLIFSEWGKHEEAEKYYYHAAALNDSVYYLAGKAYSYYNLGNHYRNIKEYDSAIVNYKRSLATYIMSKNDIVGKAICFQKLGIVYQKKGELDTALLYLNEALEASKQMNSLNDLSSAYHQLARLYKERGDIAKALNYALICDKILKETDFKKMKFMNGQLLSEIYLLKKDYKKSLHYNIIANQYKDSIFNDEKSKQITRMEVFYRSEQKQKENELLKKEQERQHAKLESDRLTIRLQKIIVVAASLLLLLLVGFTFVFYREKQKLKIANNTKNKLFSIISHDLRGPLGNFKGLIDLLLLDIANNDKEKMDSLLKMMQRTASLNYDLLENLLSWSRTESGKLDYKPEKIDLYYAVEGIFEHYDYSALNKSINLINNIDTKACVYADEYMLNTIMRNLISNAIKFTPENGKVLVKSELITEKDNEGYF